MNSENVPSTDTKEQPPKNIIEEKTTTLDGDVYIKRYTKGKLLGKGGFASVYKIVEMGMTKAMAAKVILKSSLKKAKAQQKLLSEIQIHKSLHHPHIVQFEHVFEDKEHVYILLELCSNLTLKQLLKKKKRLSEAETQVYLHQLVDGVKYLHKNGIIHRDLKLGNVFLNDKMEIKIGDFGLSARIDPSGGKRKTLCGTPNYIAPEVLLRQGHSVEADTWAIGVISFTLLVGYPPFETSDLQTIYKKISKNDYCFPEHVTLSDTAKDFINQLLILDPSKRLTCDEMLVHPFLNQNASRLIVKTKQVFSVPELPPIKSPYVIEKKDAEKKPFRISPDLAVSENLTAQKPSDAVKTRIPERRKYIRPLNKPGGGKNFLITTTKGPLSQTRVTSDQDAKETKKVEPPRLSTEEDTAESDTKVQTQQSQSENNQDIVILHWLEYAKYGLGYLLSNGVLGLLFNDLTTMHLNLRTLAFDYIVKDFLEKKDIIVTYSLSDHPQELHKKAMVLQHFKNLFESNKVVEHKIEAVQKQRKILDNHQIAPYVKKWITTQQAVMFHFSNKVLQVNFKDNTLLTVDRHKKIVTYVDAEQKELNFGLDKISSCENHDVLKRLKYTQGMLKQVWSAEKAL